MSAKKYNEHKPRPYQRPCAGSDTLLVDEGVQCANCFVLIIDNRAEVKP